MALDSKQKRGSAIELTMPHRAWLANPDGTVADTDRASLLKLASGVAPGEPAAPTFIAAWARGSNVIIGSGQA
jgi:hypothetical protein